MELLQPKDLGKVGHGGGEVVHGVNELHALGFHGHDLLAILNEDQHDVTVVDVVEKEMCVVALTVVCDADGSSVSARKQPLAHLPQGVPSSQDNLLLLARALCHLHGLLGAIRAHLVYDAQIGHMLHIDQHALKVVEDVPLGFLLLSLPFRLLLPLIPLVGEGLDEAQVHER